MGGAKVRRVTAGLWATPGNAHLQQGQEATFQSALHLTFYLRAVSTIQALTVEVNPTLCTRSKMYPKQALRGNGCRRMSPLPPGTLLVIFHCFLLSLKTRTHIPFFFFFIKESDRKGWWRGHTRHKNKQSQLLVHSPDAGSVFGQGWGRGQSPEPGTQPASHTGDR